MKKTLTAILIVTTTFGAGSSVAAQDSSKPLKWGADADGGFPYVFPSDDGKMIGFEADFAAALAREMGRPIEFQQYQFDSLIPGVMRGGANDPDLAMNGLEILPDRLKMVDFSKPYYLYQLQLVVRENETRFTNLEECKKAACSVGTLGGTAAERVLQKMGFTPEIYEDQDGQYRDLSLGRRIDAVLLDLPAAIYYASPDKHLRYSRSSLFPGLKFVGPAFAEGYYGIAVKKGNAALLEDLNRAIDRLRDSGELKRILQKWELWNADQYRLYTRGSGETEEARGISFVEFFPLLLEGAWKTVEITFCGMLLAILIGLPIALARLYGARPVQLLAAVYVEFFRGIPILLLLFFLYYGLAAISPIQLGPLQAAVLGFGLNYAAYEAEIYRAGISAIPAGQWEAAASLGMSKPLTFRRIILPQAIRIIVPPMTNDLVALFKDTSVVSIIAVVELSKQYQILSKTFGGYVQIGLTTAALYLIMSVPLGHLSRYLEQKWGHKG